jgi:hypothetical protein
MFLAGKALWAAAQDSTCTAGRPACDASNRAAHNGSSRRGRSRPWRAPTRVSDTVSHWRASEPPIKLGPLARPKQRPVRAPRCDRGPWWGPTHAIRIQGRAALANPPRIWAYTTLVMGTLGTLVAIVITRSFGIHLCHPIWETTLLVFAPVALCNVCFAIRVLREYPAPFRWK